MPRYGHFLPRAEMENSVRNLWEEVRDLNLGATAEIPHLPSPPSPLRFLRDFVSPNKPCLISRAPLSWPHSSFPSPQNDDDVLVSLHLTPNGLADSVTPLPGDSGLCFASAHVERVPLTRALDLIANSKPGLVAYAQEQNDCFRTEYRELVGECEEHVPWATEAFGVLPEAVNLWIGNQHSVTSFHKDHYENIYAVVSGEKHFTLLPPTDVHRLYIRNYATANYSYAQETREFKLDLEDPVRYVPWCSVDPYPSPETRKREIAKFPLYFNGPKPFEVTVKAGEMLYLPSMWFHHVRQSPDSQGHTIAVNYWYDMQFDIKYAYFNFLKSFPMKSLDPEFSKTTCEESPSEQINSVNEFHTDGSSADEVPECEDDNYP